jgi:ribosome-associated translation inhibitor RaiA
MREMKIQFIRGTINNETCFIHVYSNGIEIIIPPTQSNSEEKLFVYEFDNICQLKINHRIEEKKKFLSKIKTFYLQISIDGSINKQSQDIPDIIVSEDDYNTITNSINDYIYKIEEHNKKIKEREEREKRRREEIIRAQEFKNEFIHYYDSLFIFYHAKLDSETMQKKN